MKYRDWFGLEGGGEILIVLMHSLGFERGAKDA